MAIEFNVGEYARRLSRALTTRGRMPLDLDERLVPVVLTERADQAPFRDRGQCWFAPFTVQIADHAGTTAAVLVNAAATLPAAQPPRPSQVLVIDRLFIGRLGSTGSTIAFEFGYAAPQVNPAPIFTGTLRGVETIPNGQLSAWQISGDPSFTAVGSIPLGRVNASTILPFADLQNLGIVITDLSDAAPIFYLSVPDTCGVTGFVQGRAISLPPS